MSTIVSPCVVAAPPPRSLYLAYSTSGYGAGQPEHQLQLVGEKTNNVDKKSWFMVLIQNEFLNAHALLFGVLYVLCFELYLRDRESQVQSYSLRSTTSTNGRREGSHPTANKNSSVVCRVAVVIGFCAPPMVSPRWFFSSSCTIVNVGASTAVGLWSLGRISTSGSATTNTDMCKSGKTVTIAGFTRQSTRLPNHRAQQPKHTQNQINLPGFPVAIFWSPSFWR